MTATVETPRATRLRPAPAGRMLRAVWKRGIRDRRRTPLTWGLALGALCAFEVALWPSIEGSLGKAIKSYPKGLKEAFGIDQLSNVEAYLDAEMFSFMLPLAVTFLAVRCVVGVISAAEEQQHLDVLLATPLPRPVLSWAALGITAAVTGAVLAVVAALTWIAGGIAGASVGFGALAGALLAVWSLAMLFAGVASLAAGLFRRSAVVTATAMGAAVAMYVIDLVGKLASGAGGLRWASAFKYYGTPLRDGGHWLAYAGLLAVGLACGAAGAFLFERRDVL